MEEESFSIGREVWKQGRSDGEACFQDVLLIDPFIFLGNRDLYGRHSSEKEEVGYGEACKKVDGIWDKLKIGLV